MDFASVILDNVALRHNSGRFGAALILLSEMDIRNSSISNNSATNGCDLIDNDSSRLTMTNVSITDNNAEGSLLFQSTSDFESATTTLNQVTTANNNSGGVPLRIEVDTLTVANSIINDNALPGSSQFLCSGSGAAQSQGGNVIGANVDCLATQPEDVLTDNPQLGELRQYPGGHDMRMPLLSSAALGNAQNANCTDTDAVGRPRPNTGPSDGTAGCDSGALEYLPDVVFTAGFE